MGYDLHVHSNRSDGAFPPAEVVRVARDAGLEGIALTDHDTTDGLDEARAAAEGAGIEIITGCEISTVANGGPVHMLGLFFDPEEPELRRTLELLRDDREHRAREMVAKLNDLGVPITYERVRELATGSSVGRPHVAAAMVEAGVVRSTNAAFTDEWIGNKGRAYVERTTVTPLEAVRLVRGAGGAAVLAHPIWTATDGSLSDDDIAALAEAGLAGMEVRHPDHDAAARERYGAMAERLGLIGTGASDWHGNEHGGMIGAETTDRATLEALRKRAGRD